MVRDVARQKPFSWPLKKLKWLEAETGVHVRVFFFLVLVLQKVDSTLGEI